MKSLCCLLIATLTVSTPAFANENDEYEKALCKEEIKIQALSYASLLRASKRDNASLRTDALSKNVEDQVAFLKMLKNLTPAFELEALKRKTEELNDQKIAPIKVITELNLQIAKIFGHHAPAFRHHTCLEGENPKALSRTTDWIHAVEIPRRKKTVKDIADDETEPEKVAQREFLRATRAYTFETQQRLAHAISSSAAHCSIETFKQRKRRDDAPYAEASVAPSLWIRNFVIVASASPTLSLKVYAITRDNRFLVDELITVSTLDLFEAKPEIRGAKLKESLALGATWSQGNNPVLAKHQKEWILQQVTASNEACRKYIR